MSSLGARTISAAYWGIGGSAVRLVLQLGTQIVLARILGPEQYGLFAVGAIVVTLSHMFSDFGIAYGLIQRANVAPLDVRYVFTWQLMLGLLVTLAVFFSGDALAAFFDKPEAAGVVRALSLVCLLNALAAPSLNLLKRSLDSRRILLSQVTAFAVGYVLVGVPMALMGMQVWALVAAWLTQAGVNLVLLYAATRHSVVPVLRHPDAKALSGYGGLVMLSNLANWSMINIDRAIVGRVFPSRDIGLYATSYNILQTPAAALLDSVQPVFFAASTKIAGDSRTLAASYRALMAATSLYLMPVFVALATIAETFIVTLYGAQWRDAAPLLAPLALSMPLYFVAGLTTPLLWTGGHASKDFKAQLPLAVLWGVVCWYAASISVVAVAWAVFGLCLFRAVLFVLLVSHYLRLERAPIWRSVRGGLLCSAVVGGASWSVNQLADHLPPVLRMLLVALAGAAVLVLMLRTLPRLIAPDLRQLNGRLLARMPDRIRRPLTFLYQGTIDVGV